jgi:hypothetical protein
VNMSSGRVIVAISLLLRERVPSPRVALLGSRVTPLVLPAAASSPPTLDGHSALHPFPGRRPPAEDQAYRTRQPVVPGPALGTANASSAGWRDTRRQASVSCRGETNVSPTTGSSAVRPPNITSPCQTNSDPGRVIPGRSPEADPWASRRTLRHHHATRDGPRVALAAGVSKPSDAATWQLFSTSSEDT